MPAVMGVALDPTGEAIPLANEGEEIGDFNGAISGDLELSASGWLTVDAIGYATAYAQIFGEVNGVELFEARLTPFSAGTTLLGDESGKLKILDVERLSVEINVDAGLFVEVPVRLMLAVIDRLDVGPSYENVDDRSDLNLHHAFALQAFDEGLQEIPLPGGSSISAEVVVPVELGGDVVLATFNPVSGSWESLPDACSQIDPLTYACSLDRLSPLFGLFHPAEIVREPVALSETGMFGVTAHAGRLLLDLIPSPRAIEGGQWDNQFKTAWDKIADWINNNPDGSLDDPELQELVDQLIDAALEFAAENRSEAGKLHLIKSGEPALMLGAYQLADAAYSEAAHIAYEMGKEILKDPNCGKFQEAFRIAENNLLLAGLVPSVDNEKNGR